MSVEKKITFLLIDVSLMLVIYLLRWWTLTRCLTPWALASWRSPTLTWCYTSVARRPCAGPCAAYAVTDATRSYSALSVGDVAPQDLVSMPFSVLVRRRFLTYCRLVFRYITMFTLGYIMWNTSRDWPPAIPKSRDKEIGSAFGTSSYSLRQSVL